MESTSTVIEPQESINDRLSVLVDYFEKGKKAAFARKVDISPQAAQEILAGRRSEPSYKVLVRILKGYPQVCTDWLVLGRGPMLQDEGINGALKRPIYATADQYEEAKRHAEESFLLSFESLEAVKPELAAQLRRTQEAERANAYALQEALMQIYAVGDSAKSANSRLATRLAISEEQALQLIKGGQLRGTGVYSYEDVSDNESPKLVGYRVSELAVREYLGEPVKYISPWDLNHPRYKNT